MKTTDRVRQTQADKDRHGHRLAMTHRQARSLANAPAGKAKTGSQSKQAGRQTHRQTTTHNTTGKTNK
eukprot:13901219-Alexandrium_andersonii.AAC.1